MIERIRDHNALNGVRFATVEFSVIACVGIVLTIIMQVLGHWVPGLIFMGITANCLVVAVIGARSLKSGDLRGGLRLVNGKAPRNQSASVRPQVLIDTVIFVILLLVPFAVLIATAVEILMARRQVKR